MPFNGYNENFPYSNKTAIWANNLPPWMKMANDPTSVGQQFLNSFALTLDEIDDAINQALYNQYIGQANLGEIAWVTKAFHGLRLSPSKRYKVKADGNEVNVVSTLREFYENKGSAILDFDKMLIYLNTEHPYDSLELIDRDGQTIWIGNKSSQVKHHIWNCFDELGLLVGLMRRNGEGNEDFAKRIKNVFRYPGNSSHMGLIFGLAGQMDLIESITWEKNNERCVLPVDTYIESIKVGNRFSRQEELEIKEDAVEIKNEVLVFPDNKPDQDYTLNKCEIRDGKIVLAPSALSGIITTPVISIDNLEHWNNLILKADIPEETAVSVDVMHYELDVAHVENLTDGDEVIVTLIEDGVEEKYMVDSSVRLRVKLSRPDTTYESPSVDLIMLSYENTDAEVTYIKKDSIKLDVLSDEQFKKELTNPDGSPSNELKQWAQELSDMIPILWNKFIWDEAYWDVIDKNLMGLDVLPHRWDPTIDRIASKYLQIGVGDGLDLKVADIAKQSDWNLRITSGTYFAGENLDEYYLFAKPTTEFFVKSDENNQVKISGTPMQGAPVIVETDNGYLTQVSFLDEDFNYTIENEEVVIADGGPDIYLKYNDLDLNHVNITDNDNGSYTPLIEQYDTSNRISLSPVPKRGTELRVSYRVKNSFIISNEENGSTITFSEEQNNIKITYEDSSDTKYYVETRVTIDPSLTHFNQGFIYVANQIGDTVRMSASADPDIVRANGYDRSVVHIDCFDQWGNPTNNNEISGTASIGTLTLVAISGNRSTFRYTAPSSIATDTKAELTFSVPNGTSVKTSILVKAGENGA